MTQRWPGRWSRRGGGGHCCHLLKQPQESSADPQQQCKPLCCSHNAPSPGPSLVNALALLTPRHDLALNLGKPQSAKDMTLSYNWAESKIPTQAALSTSVSTQMSLSSRSLPLDQKPQCGEKGKYLKGTDPTLVWPSEFYSRNLGADPYPWQGCRRHWAEKSHLTSCAGFNSSNTSHTLSQSDSGQQILARKDVTGVHIESRLHTTDTRHMLST